MKIYFDENFSPHLVAGFRAFQEGRRSEYFEVLHVVDDFGQGCEDKKWISGVAQRHGCVITQDLNIHRRKYQWDLCRKYKVGMFFFNQPKKKKFDYWRWIEQVFKFWNQIKEISKTAERPFGYAFDHQRRKPIKL